MVGGSDFGESAMVFVRADAASAAVAAEAASRASRSAADQAVVASFSWTAASEILPVRTSDSAARL